MPTVIKQSTSIIFVIAAAMTSHACFTAVVALLIAYSLFGPAQCIKALALSVVLKHINPTLGTYDTTSSVLFLALLLSSGLRVLPLLRELNVTLISVWAFSMAAMVLSVISSLALSVSIMKVLTFAWAVTTVLSAFAALTTSELVLVKQWLSTFVLTVIASSALTLLFPAVAYQLVPGSLQGILNHPQSLGTFAAPAAAWTLSELVLMRLRTRSMPILVTILVWAVMLLTLARTAAIAAASAIVIASLTRVLGRQRIATQTSLARLAGVIVVGALAIIFANIVTGQLNAAVSGFVLKRHSSSVSDSFIESRGEGIASQWHNFLARPFLGHGFGVFPDGHFPAGVVAVAGIPISAPVEKGFVPTAVLEETGVIGGCLFLLMLASLGNGAGRNSDLRWVAAFWAAVLVNLGEAVIFSPGGIGLYIWLVIGLCVALGCSDKARLRVSGEAVCKASPVRTLPNLLH